MRFNVTGNNLLINEKIIRFSYPIYKAEEFGDLIIVLLEFKKNNDPLEFSNQLYAVSGDGQIIWKMEDVRKHLGEYKPAPLVDFNIIEGRLFAFDYYARKYCIDAHNGSIESYSVGRW